MHGGAVGAFFDLLRVEPSTIRRFVGFVIHHALGEQPGKRLIHPDMPGFLHRSGEEAGVEQVQNRVFDPTDILIDGHPAIDGGAIQRLRGIGGAGIARKIPRAIDECVECVGFPPRRLAAARAVHVLPSGVMVQRVAGAIERHVLR